MAFSLTNVRTGVNVAGSLDLAAFALTQRAYAETSRLSFKVRDELSAISILAEDEFVMMDGATKIFAGYVRALRKTDTSVSVQRIYEVECQDYTTCLADDVVDGSAIRSIVETDAQRIAWLFSTYGFRGVAIGAYVQTVKAVMPEQDFTGLTLHQALTLISSVTGASFYVDYDKGLHYFTSEVNSAPFNLSDTPNFSTTWPYEQFSEATDTVDFINAVYVIGDGIADWRPSAAVVATLRASGQLRATVLSDTSIVDATMLAARGDSLLTTFGVQKHPSSLVTYHPGLKAGQNVQISHAGWGIAAATYRISSLDAHLVSKDRVQYQVNFGNAPVSMADLMGGQTSAIAGALAAAQDAVASAVSTVDLSVAGANLIPNSGFEDGTSWGVGAQWVIGYAVADALDRLKVARLTIAGVSAGTLVTPMMNVAKSDFYWVSFWHFFRSRTSGTLRAMVKEYNAASVLLATTTFDMAAVDTEWTRKSWRFGPAPDPNTIAWQPSTAKVQISFDSAGAVGTYTADVDGVQLERGKIITAYAPAPFELLDGSITTVKIADDAITAPKIIANGVVAGKIAAGAVTTATIAANAITADKLTVGLVAGGGNILRNGGFRKFDPVTQLPSDWIAQSGGAPGFGSAMWAIADPTWTLRDGDVDGWTGTGPPYGTTVYLFGTSTISAFEPYIVQSVIPVVGGEYYSASGLIGLHRLSGGRIQVDFFDAAGTPLSSNASPNISSPAAGMGGASRSGWNYVTIEGMLAPSTAAFAVFYFVGRTPNTSGSDWYLFCDEAWMGVGKAAHPFDPSEATGVRNRVGNVEINATGILITDTGGQAVLTAGGFSGSWDDFLASGGIYNSTFGSGTIGALSNGSPNLPYWSISQGDATAAGSLAVDAAVGSGRRITLDATPGSSTWSMRQRVPIVTQFPRGVPVPFTATAHFYVAAASGAGAVGPLLRLTLTTLTKAGAPISSRNEFFDLKGVAPGGHDVSAAILLDPTAAYVEIKIGFESRSTVSGTVYLYGVERTQSDVLTPISNSATGALTLTTSVVGSSWCLIVLPPGRWLVRGIFDFSIGTTGPVNCQGSLLLGSSCSSGELAKLAILGDPGAGARGTVIQEWIVDVVDGSVVARSVELGVKKGVNAGVAAANMTHSSIRAFPVVDGLSW